jgi:hypothetical protein
MTRFNIAYRQTLRAGRLTLGLMTPLARANGAMADPASELQLAKRADALGFAALWTRDVPVMVPQGEEISVLDEPFVWLATLAGATARFPITKKWPAQHPERLQLYSLPTPNGVKVSIMLEETGLPYEPHLVSFETNDQMSPEFLSLNPNNKIPAILDPNGPAASRWRCSSRAPSWSTWRPRPASSCRRTRPGATRRCSG